MRHLVEGIEALEVRKASHDGRRMVKIWAKLGENHALMSGNWCLHIINVYMYLIEFLMVLSSR